MHGDVWRRRMDNSPQKYECLTQGAPLLPRSDGGDSFDYMVQRWFSHQTFGNQNNASYCGQHFPAQTQAAGDQFANAQGHLFHNVQNFIPQAPGGSNVSQGYRGLHQPQVILFSGLPWRLYHSQSCLWFYCLASPLKSA